MKKLILVLTVICALFFAMPAYASSIGGIGVYLNGEKQNIEARANNGRTLLPVRAFCNMMEMRLDYDGLTPTIKVYVDKDIYTFTLNSKQVLCNGKAVTPLDTVPYLYRGHTYLPVRYIAELIDTDVKWNSQKRAVEITIPELTVENGVLTRYGGLRKNQSANVQDKIVDLSYRTDIIEIGEKAFWKASVSEVLLPPTLKKIGHDAFYGSNLKKISIPDSVSEIGVWAFNHCYNLEYIHLPDELTAIRGEAFLGSKIKELVIPAKVTTIEPEIFALGPFDNPAIRTVVLPPSVTDIHDAAFSYCDNLTIQGLAGSYAETYAKAHNIQFTAISETELAQKLATR